MHNIHYIKLPACRRNTGKVRVSKILLAPILGAPEKNVDAKLLFAVEVLVMDKIECRSLNLKFRISLSIYLGPRVSIQFHGLGPVVRFGSGRIGLNESFRTSS